MSGSAWLAPMYLGWLLHGAWVTIVLTLLVALFATPLGVLLCMARLTGTRLLRWPAHAYLLVFRNTPLLVQLFVWYFGVAALLPDAWLSWLNTAHRLALDGVGVSWPSFEYLAGFVGLTLYSTAFIAEECRAGVRAVPLGQYAAAVALGLKPAQVWRHVVWPQALRHVMPPLLGQYMNLLKNSSLCMVIGVAELSYASRQVESETFLTFQAFGIATLLYIGLIALIEVFGQWLQRSGERTVLPQ